MRGIALEVALQAALALGHGELVAGLGEMVHADVDVAGARQPPDRERQDLQLGLGVRQIGLARCAAVA